MLEELKKAVYEANMDLPLPGATSAESTEKAGCLSLSQAAWSMIS